jgi:hypothetical protein
MNNHSNLDSKDLKIGKLEKSLEGKSALTYRFIYDKFQIT